MKTTLDLRPVYHRREDRIRAHVLLCWLALLLVRIAETATGETWRNLAWELEKLHLGRFVGPATRHGAWQRLQPVAPETVPPANCAVAMTSSGTRTRAPSRPR